MADMADMVAIPWLYRPDQHYQSTAVVLQVCVLCLGEVAAKTRCSEVPPDVRFWKDNGLRNGPLHRNENTQRCPHGIDLFYVAFHNHCTK